MPLADLIMALFGMPLVDSLGISSYNYSLQVVSGFIYAFRQVFEKLLN